MGVKIYLFNLCFLMSGIYQTNDIAYIIYQMSLDQVTAQKRFGLIRPNSIQYNFHIILEKEIYHGLAEITFYLQTINFEQDLEIDFTGEVEEVIINNVTVKCKTQENFIFLPKACLQKGKNRVSVLYQNEYNIDLSGLISFEDDDGEQFIYTDFEPYYANRVFPCFDQPSLKASMKLTVLADQNWKVLSNENPNPSFTFSKQSYLSSNSNSHGKQLYGRFSEKVKDNTKITTFPSTQQLATYLFCFAAGNYMQIANPNPDAKLVPMSLFSPPSSYANLQRYSNFIFDITIKCMRLFQQKFKVNYPFRKYDQIFIKQCHALAMQNAAIVTFNQPYLLPKDQPTIYDYYYIGLVVSHELSHHWFGNYVTMVWWDDLWLNESFAEWISCYSIEQLIKRGETFGGVAFQSSYLYFRHGKVYGYEEDERNSATHPIRGPVNNTDESLSIFDGITYEKGASCLKQLTYLVGENNFFTAVSNYFSRFAWANATIDDLLDDLKDVYKDETVDLDIWKKTWLETASLNVFTADWRPEDNKIQINQTSFNDNNVLRIHKMKISLFKVDGTFDVLVDQMINSDSFTTLTYEGAKDLYKAILINHEDHTFVQNIIDPVSLSYFKKNIDKIPDLLTRMMIWYNIRSMVNLAYVPIIDYVNLVLDKLFIEKNNFILQTILQNLLNYLKIFVADPTGSSLRSNVFLRLYSELQSVDDTLKQRIQILSVCYIDYGASVQQINKLKDWLEGKDVYLSKRVLNLDQKYKIVKKIYTLANLPKEDKNNIFAIVSKQDKEKSRVNDNKKICEIIIADPAYFDQIYNQFKLTTISIAEKEVKIEGWKNDCHNEWIDRYEEQYYKDVVALSTELSYQQFQFFYENLKPVNSNLAYQRSKFIEVISELQKKGNLEQHCRNLRKHVDDLSKRIRNLAYNSDINNALSKVRADTRFSYIKTESISYNSHIAFEQSSPYYTGVTQITFTLTSVPIFLPLDCISDKIYALFVNGSPVYPNSNAQFVFIHEDYLKKGQNFISIHYRNIFNNDGLGCMFYLQTVDTPNRQYVYTKFQPYGAHRFFPCFDQPDLKATAVFNVIVPTKWTAASNSKLAESGVFSIEDYEGKAATKDKALLQSYLSNKSGSFYIFQQTKLISTYLFCVVAGEYFALPATEAQTHNKIPMTLYCIQSYSKYLTDLSPFIFEMTTRSLKLYEDNFGVQYPFTKYDSVFCHEFKSGAMENVGIITFNDTYLYPQKVSIEKMLAFASTIVHQNAHNWFGNLVTMKWWDDLWLNQSFADFIAHWCLQKIKNDVESIPTYDSGWKIFLVRGVAGYRQDQITQTTHAVRSEVENTSIATTYFDRITYQKGSATLKQLMFLMEEANFFKGVQDYFKQFGWKNGTINDFLGKMQKYFGVTAFTLDDWKQSWLRTPSLNTVSVEWDPTDISEKAYLKIKQGYYAEQYPTLRYHSTKVALFKENGEYDTIDILLQPKPETTLEYDGSKNYKAVLVNVEYWDYFKYTIDDTSLVFLQANLNNIKDVLTRMIIMHDINEQVRDSKIRVDKFIAFLLSYIFIQTDDKIFQFQFAFLRDLVNSYLPIPSRASVKKDIFEAVYNALANLPPANDRDNRIKLLKDQLTVFANPNENTQIEALQNWRNGSSIELKAYPITSTQGWQVVKLIYSVADEAEYNINQKQAKYKDQASYYPGIKAQLTKNTCDTIIASSDRLKEVYQLFRQMSLSLDQKGSYAEGWNNFLHRDELQLVYKPKYFEDLPLMSRILISNHFEFFYQNLKPIDDNLEQTIDSYRKIKLQGANMIGHQKVLTQIRYGYELRKKLYEFNA